MSWARTALLSFVSAGTHQPHHTPVMHKLPYAFASNHGCCTYLPHHRSRHGLPFFLSADGRPDVAHEVIIVSLLLGPQQTPGLPGQTPLGTCLVPITQPAITQPARVLGHLYTMLQCHVLLCIRPPSIQVTSHATHFTHYYVSVDCLQLRLHECYESCTTAASLHLQCEQLHQVRSTLRNARLTALVLHTDVPCLLS